MISDRTTFFQKQKIDVCIEDSFETCREFYDNGIKAILMTTPMNKDITVYYNTTFYDVIRCNVDSKDEKYKLLKKKHYTDDELIEYCMNNK